MPVMNTAARCSRGAKRPTATSPTVAGVLLSDACYLRIDPTITSTRDLVPQCVNYAHRIITLHSRWRVYGLSRPVAV